MSEQQQPQIHQDFFEKYFVTRLVPFIIKYRNLLAGTFIGIIIIFISAGAYSIHSENKTKAVLNDIYTTLSAKKEITPEVLEELNSRYSDHPASLEIKWLLAGKYSEKDDCDNAIRVYNEIINLAPGSGPALQSILALAACQEQKGQYGDALETYDRCIAEYGSSDSVRIYAMYRKAAAHFHLKQYDQADTLISKIEIFSSDSKGTSAASDIQDKIDILKHRISINKN